MRDYVSQQFDLEFLKLGHVVWLLRKTGASEEVIALLLKEKARVDRAHEEHRRLFPPPSLN